MKLFKNQLFKAVKILLFCLLVFGVLYPAAVYGCSKLFCPDKADGSFEETDYGNMSLLAGQSFSKDENLWGRKQYGKAIRNEDGSWVWMAMPADHAIDSEGYKEETERLKKEIEKRNPDAAGPVPEELYTWSASGMDPDISLQAALYQVPRIAKARGVSEQRVIELIESHVQDSLPGSAVGKRVNVTRVNLALNELAD